MGNKTILERLSLDGRTSLVTGGGSGIGRSFCHALGEAGAKVAVVDIDLSAAETVRDELLTRGMQAVAIRTDVTSESDVTAMVERVVDKWGSLTIAMNNAGIGIWRDSIDMTMEEWQNVININLSAVYLCAREEAKVMANSGYGKIVNTASMSGHIVNTPQNQAAYNTSKAGVLHLTKSLAAEWAAKGIRVNSISPGYTKTLLVEKLLETPEGQSMLPKWLEKIPMNRMATPEDLQGAAIYLSSEASDYTTGSDIIIDGGYCTW
ncbi:MAG: glucose 1-dehydrogenase [Spirochaetaceae bacterium]|nr:glucose 1-dehydrogenase [Spirochaetaceae bacterium]